MPAGEVDTADIVQNILDSGRSGLGPMASNGSLVVRKDALRAQDTK